MFYALGTEGDETVYMDKERGLNSHIALTLGRAWDIAEDEVELPYRFTMRVEPEEAPTMLPWFPAANLMQVGLVELLRREGATNLQTFPTEIRREDDGERVPGYLVTNVVGNVPMHSARPVLAQSACVLHDNHFDVADVGDLVVFRCGALVVVRAQVRDAILAAGIEGLLFTAAPAA